MSRKLNRPTTGHTLERMEPRILLSADLLGGALGDDAANNNGLDQFEHLDSQQDLSQLIAPLIQNTLIQNTPIQNNSSDNSSQENLQQRFIQFSSLNFKQLEGLFIESAEDINGEQENDFFGLLNSANEDHPGRQEIIFIDAATPDYEQLVEDITSREQETSYLIFILDSDQDGVQQISDLLANHQGIDAIHIVSHGDEGSISLGNGELNSDNLRQYTELLTSWQLSLDKDADLLIYGCNLAGNETGRDLLQALGQFTGTDIAASDDLTGDTELGGDWELEYEIGSVETQLAFSSQLQQQWQNTLATFTVNTTNDTVDANVGDGLALDTDGNTSLRAAIMEANFDATADVIILPVGTYTLTLGSGDDNASSGDLDIREDLTITGADAATTIIDGNSNDRVFEIRTAGTDVNMTNLTVQSGSTSSEGGGIHVQEASSTLTADHIIVTGNDANKGGGIFNKGTLTLTDSIIANNGTPATSEGGGLANHGDATLDRVTVSGNKAIDGAGLHQDNAASNLKLTNVTVSGNTATGLGGGLYAEKPTTILNSTFTLNLANAGGGIHQDIGAVNIKNTIVSGNSASTSDNVKGTFNSLDYNLIEDTIGASGFGGNDILGGADLNILAANGGFGKTHALLGTSNAIDPVGLTGAPAVDQQGFNRDGTPDIGAFEFGATGANTDPTLVNPIADQAATEDTAFNFQFATNVFNDAEGDGLTYKAELSGGGALPGWLDFNAATRTFSGTPLNGDVGTVSVEVTANDGHGGTAAIDTFDIVVSNSNDDPTLDQPISDQAATEDVAFNFQFPSNTFGDADVGDTLTYTAEISGGGALPGWLSFNAGTRTFSGTPLNGDIGTISVELTADDGNGGTAATDTFDIVISNSNDDPTLDNAISDQIATKNAAYNFTFAANTFGDVDVGDTLTYSAQLMGGGALPGWLSFDAATRTFSGTPLLGDVGTIKIEVTADDGNGGTAATDTFDLVVKNNNLDPTLVSAINNKNATEDTPFNFTFAVATFNDADVGDTLTYTARLSGGGALPGWLSFDGATRTFSGTPLNGDVGTISVQVFADDGHGGTRASSTFDIVIANSNDDPTLDNAISDQNVARNTPFNFTFAANTFGDVDVGDSLTYSAQLAGGGALPGWLSFNAGTRTFSGTPLNGDVGTITVAVTADDGNGGTVAIDTFDIVVLNSNVDPILNSSLADQSATEDAPFSFTFAANTFTDGDGDSLTYNAQLNGGGALPDWLSFNAATRTFSGTPLNDDIGTLSVQVTADDGNGGTPASDSFNIVVNNSNDDPTLDNPPNDQTITEEEAFSFALAANTFSDIDAGDTLAYSAQLAGGGALPTWLSFNPSTLTFSGTAVDGSVGMITVEVVADDGNGGTPASTSFNIVVLDNNQDPILVSPIGNQVANEDSPFSFALGSGTFSDADGDSLTYSASLAGGGALPGWLSFDSSTLVFSGTPSNADVGVITVQVVADDGNGGTPASTVFNLQINNQNDAPIGTVNISGDLSVGSSLTASNSLADGDGMGVVSYQWQRDGAVISGATGSNYVLSSDDVGSNISVVASYIDGQGTAESVGSTPVLIIGGVDPTPGSSGSDSSGGTSDDSSSAADTADSVTESTTETEEAPAETTEEEAAAEETEEPAPEVSPEGILIAGNDDDADEEAAAAELLRDRGTISSGISSSVDQRPENLRLEINFDEANEVTTETSVVSSFQRNFTPLSDPTVLVSTQDFIRGIDQLREEVANESKISKTMVGSSFAVSASMSAGYVVWLARSGVLLSGVLSALPAWRFIDPLPVLASSGAGTDEDDESLESLVESSETESSEADSNDQADSQANENIGT